MSGLTPTHKTQSVEADHAPWIQEHNRLQEALPQVV
jgi:hypothetical protein